MKRINPILIFFISGLILFISGTHPSSLSRGAETCYRSGISEGDFMSAFLNDVNQLVAVCEADELALDDIQQASNATYTHIESASRDEINDALRKLADHIGDVHPLVSGLLAINCGGFVENGGDPTIALPAIVEELPEMFDKMFACYQRCYELHQAKPKDDSSEEEEANIHLDAIVEDHIRTVYAEQPELAFAYSNYRPMYLSTVAHLSVSKELRRNMPRKDEILHLTQQHDYLVGGPRSFLTKILLVLDDEPLIVLDPAQQKGFQVTIGGIADNFQLNVLLSGALIGDPSAGWLDYPPMDAAAVAEARGEGGQAKSVTGSMFLWNWFAIDEYGSAIAPLKPKSVGERERIWNEGVPSDIEAFEGHRIVLTAPPIYHSSWSAGRVFGNLQPLFRVDRALPSDEVQSWLQRISNAKRREPTAN